MGVAENQTLQAWCPSCMKDTHSSVGMNGSAQLINMCGVCGNPKTRTAMTKPLADFDQETERPVPVQAAAPAQPTRPAAVAPVIPLRPTDMPAPRITAAPLDAVSIVEEARASLMRLEVQIPELEGALAAARAQRKGLQKMIAAYDAGAKTKTKAKPAAPEES